MANTPNRYFPVASLPILNSYPFKSQSWLYIAAKAKSDKTTVFR